MANVLGTYGLSALGNTLGYGANQLGLAMQKKRDKSSANESYDNNARAAYINYLKQQNAMNEAMNNNGITGGASETAMVNAANNYARNQAINNAGKSNALASIDNNYRDASLQNFGNYITNMNSTFDKAVQQNFAEEQFDETVRQNDILNKMNDINQIFQTLPQAYTQPAEFDTAIAELDPEDPMYSYKKTALMIGKAAANIRRIETTNEFTMAGKKVPKTI